MLVIVCFTFNILRMNSQLRVRMNSQIHIANKRLKRLNKKSAAKLETFPRLWLLNYVCFLMIFIINYIL